MVEVSNYREEAIDKLYGIGGNCKMNSVTLSVSSLSPFFSLSLSKWGSIVKLSDFSGFITLSIPVAVDHTMLNQLLLGLLLID
ncbi:hypothetical protein LWI29_018512 [Acer saccharum]|uniref:Uncharacterized protein n=1 Tax=Acer saccharum TaxID=4024 RepID=A0AA39SK30_ACESA|nr:hypothetical protein LWI29_009645 [Acer saccharum]KAK0592403.1 hypothetical protein LWI29_018512 [Acer saccharum]